MPTLQELDSGWVNATAEQEAPPTKDGGINPKGWWEQVTEKAGALSQSLFIPLIAPFLSQSLFIPLIAPYNYNKV